MAKKYNIKCISKTNVDGKFSERLRAALERGNTPDVDSIEADDLNKNGSESNIQRGKMSLEIFKLFKWHPKRIFIEARCQWKSLTV